MPSAQASYRANAPVCEADRRACQAEVVFYQLSTKFVDDARSIPENTQDVLYYTLAVGHHTGVIDCFEEKLRCPLEAFMQAAALLGDEAARYKLEGLVRGGEIQIDKSHLSVLLPSVEQVLNERPDGEGTSLEYLEALFGLLKVLDGNASAYIMGRVRENER